MCQSKLVEYAYPSSTHATKEGFGKTGCWFVSLYPSVNACIGGKAVFHSLTEQEAVDYATSLPDPYNWMHKVN